MIILIFKTNVMTHFDVSLLSKDLDQIAGRQNWYIDVSDSDKVLRIEALCDLSAEIRKLLSDKGFKCNLMQ